MIEVIKKIITKVPNVTGIGINYYQYSCLIKSDDNQIFYINGYGYMGFDCSAGCTILGIPLYIFDEIEDEHFRIDVNKKLQWSDDINILDVDKIDRILKLQVFA